MELKGVLLSQPWGMYGLRGLAARLYATVQGKSFVDPAIPFGEYIIGGDRFYETYVVTKDEYINKFFERLTECELGETAYCEFGSTLPFTVRIVSVRIPGPCLCYPSEEKANLLHSKNAKRFLTTGERSQMVVALNDFMFLVGFRDLDFIIEVLENVPEFRIIIDGTLIDKLLKTKEKTDFLKVFKDLLDNLPSQIEYTGKLLKDRLLNTAPSCIRVYHSLTLFERLVNDNPSDIGIFLPYFLNVITLKRLEGMVIPAGTPFAYLYGQALECSNTVENAAAAAFWSRRDIDSFCECLDLRFWTPGELHDLSTELRSVDNNINEYLNPSPSYRVFIGTIPARSKQSIPRLSSFSILLIIEGDGKINDCLVFVPGAAFLFFKRQDIIFQTVERVSFAQVSINLLA